MDSLRGSITPEREWWDLTYYHLKIEVIPDNKRIVGSNAIQYKGLKDAGCDAGGSTTPLRITKVVQGNKELEFRSEKETHILSLQEEQKIGAVKELIVYYEGKPKEAVRAPWDGGFSWKKDKNNTDFIATSCQGLGASIWWPCKDHMYDEVDSMDISVEVPEHLLMFQMVN